MIQMKDGLNPGIVQLEARDWGVNGEIPISFGEEVTTRTPRARVALKMKQFPINIAKRYINYKVEHSTILLLQPGAWEKYGHMWLYPPEYKHSTVSFFGSRLNNLRTPDWHWIYVQCYKHFVEQY